MYQVVRRRKEGERKLPLTWDKTKKKKERKEKNKRKKGQVACENKKGGMWEEISHFDQVRREVKRRRKTREKKERGRREREDFPDVLTVEARWSKN